MYRRFCLPLPTLRRDGARRLTFGSKNDHERGDQWNGEDLSIFSVDDSLLPVSALPRMTDLSESTTSLYSGRKDVGEDESISPTNLKQTLATPPISSQSARASPGLTSSNPGYRAAEAYVRPAPMVVVGTVMDYTFDLRKCEFTLRVQATTTPGDAPTVVFLPEFHFPKDTCIVEVTSGKWEISSDDDDDPAVLPQSLKWWHGEGEQTLKVVGMVRKHNFVEGVSEEGGYYEQFNQWAGLSCALM